MSMISMRIKLNKDLIIKDDIYDYDELLGYFQDEIEYLGAETWIDDWDYLHCDVYDILYHSTCNIIVQIYDMLRSMDVFGKYCLCWGLISEYDIQHTKMRKGIYTEDILATEILFNSKFFNYRSEEEIRNYKPVDYGKIISE